MNENSEAVSISNSLNEINVYFKDILRNKQMIKEMLKTNILVYEDKIIITNDKISTLKDDLKNINSDFSIKENKLKLEYAKNHDEFQKHDINFKLLDKTNSHYKMLIREREDEVKKLEEQSIFAYQDYQNKKVKLDCISVQTVEAEFQLNILQKQIDQQINKMIEQKDKESVIQNELIENNSIITPTNYNSTRKIFITNNLKTIDNSNKESAIFDQISMSNDSFRKKDCNIY